MTFNPEDRSISLQPYPSVEMVNFDEITGTKTCAFCGYETDDSKNIFLHIREQHPLSSIACECGQFTAIVGEGKCSFCLKDNPKDSEYIKCTECGDEFIPEGGKVMCNDCIQTAIAEVTEDEDEYEEEEEMAKKCNKCGKRIRKGYKCDDCKSSGKKKATKTTKRKVMKKVKIAEKPARSEEPEAVVYEAQEEIEEFPTIEGKVVFMSVVGGLVRKVWVE